MTLVIMSVSIADEGIYTCDVDRINQTAVLDIVSCLDVSVTPSKPFPQITECNAIGQDEICNLSFSAETETNITCILSGFYPDGRATLEWLHQDLTPESSVQEDETFCFERTNVRVASEEPGPVKNAWIIIGPIAAVIVAILTVIIIITILIHWRKRRRKELPLGQPGEGTSSPEERTTDSNVSRGKNVEKHESGDAPGSDSNKPSDTEKENLSENYPLLPLGQPGDGTSTPEERTTDTDVSRRTNAEKQQPEAPENDNGDLSGPLLSKERPNEATSSPEERISDIADISKRKNGEKHESGDAPESEPSDGRAAKSQKSRSSTCRPSFH
ncbi:uncharacterized protein [Diadema setosum]|uniref:uncharacterized protein n=1 Tax=Diadema setosum TaxID=31175 RepID=UPI003B3B97D0